jgi:hypothetical protein
MNLPRHTFVLQPLIPEVIGDPQCPETLRISSVELERMRQDPRSERGEFRSSLNAPTYRVVGRSLDGFLIVRGDPHQ